VLDVFHGLILRAKRSAFVRQASVVASGTFVAQLLTLLSLPLVTRLFSPAEIGAVALFAAFAQVAIRLGGLRYESALLLVRSENQLTHLMLLCLGLTVVVTAVSMGTFFAVHRFDILGFGELPAWTLGFMPAVVLGGTAFAVLRMWLLRSEQVGEIRRATIARSLGHFVVRISGGLAGLGLLALIVAELVAAWMAVGAALRAFMRQARRRTRALRLVLVRRLARRYAKFPLLELPSVLIDGLALALPIPIVASLFGLEAAGLYTLAHRLLALSSGQVSGAVADIFQMRFATAVRADSIGAGRTLYWQVLKALALFGLPPFVLVMVLAPPLTGLVFGERWSESGTLMAIMVPWLYGGFVVSTLSRVLVVLQRQELKLMYDALALALVLICFWVAQAQVLSLTTMVGLLAAVRIGAYGGFLALQLVALRGADKVAPGGGQQRVPG
jgi:O-antigen/teichoic acid export membrane protein